MPEWLFIALFFGIGPVIVLLMLAYARLLRHREDVEAWERGQALRRQLREQRPTSEQKRAGETAMRVHGHCETEGCVSWME